MKGEVVKKDYLGFLTAITEIMAARAQYTSLFSPCWAGKVFAYISKQEAGTIPTTAEKA